MMKIVSHLKYTIKLHVPEKKHIMQLTSTVIMSVHSNNVYPSLLIEEVEKEPDAVNE